VQLTEAELAVLIQDSLEQNEKPIELASRILAGYEAMAMNVQETLIAEREGESVALFDLDGTLADFDGAMTRGMRALAGPDEPIWTSANEQNEPSYLTARRRLVKQIPGFWSGLPQIQDGFTVLDMARELDFRIMVLSRGPRTNAVAWGEKLEWCRINLPEEVQVTLTEDKGLVYGRVLVDDWPAYILRWLEWRKRGLVIMPNRDWNQGFSHPQVVRYTMGQNDTKVRQMLSECRSRK
jgi:5'-nucleotidase